MKLNFSILWFDDNEAYLDSLDTEDLESEILSWGFTPVIDLVSTPEDFNAHSPFEHYDLIIVDQNLEGYPDGENFIADLRGHEVFTEVIFYTAGNASKLWDGIRDKELEGIFVTTKGNEQAKIALVGQQSIRKILDLENMRGIVMAEVGELDHQLAEILHVGISSLESEQQNTIFTKFHTKMLANQSTHEKILEEFKQSPKVESMLSLCDSSKQWQNFNRLKKQHAELKKDNPVGNYEQEILWPRNFLAHGRPTKEADGSFTFSFQGKKFAFNDEVSRDLRHTIVRYKEGFAKIFNLLK
jgi:hypothetical protein